jgi:hypothetical protein
MRKAIGGLLSATLIFGVTAFATYPGSVVSSFLAEYIPDEGYPMGITYGEGYVWVTYVYDLVTKRRPKDGSIVTSFRSESWADESGWEENHKYIYNVGAFGWIYWSDSATGSTIGSFPKPGTGALSGVDYYDGAPSQPIWVVENVPAMAWNLTPKGSVVSSYSLRSWLYLIRGLAYDGDTPGGDYLFLGLFTAPSYIFVVKVDTFSLISSFVAPVGGRGISDLSWDGRYLWALENGPPPAKPGWVYRFVAHSSPNIEPASIGKIKALYR